jgi:predicted DNA-binding transcriptional regulator YafY
MDTPTSKAMSRTHTHIKRVFEVAAILQATDKWWTLEEVSEAYRDRVSTRWCHRTIRRDIELLNDLGVAETRKVSTGFKWDHHEYRFVALPFPIY